MDFVKYHRINSLPTVATFKGWNLQKQKLAFYLITQLYNEVLGCIRSVLREKLCEHGHEPLSV